MGSITLAELLEPTPTTWSPSRSSPAQSLPGVGKVKARRTMDEVGIADTPAPARPRRPAAQGAAGGN